MGPFFGTKDADIESFLDVTLACGASLRQFGFRLSTGTLASINLYDHGQGS
jgi:hypothetical protein